MSYLISDFLLCLPTKRIRKSKVPSIEHRGTPHKVFDKTEKQFSTFTKNFELVEMIINNLTVYI